MNQCRNSLHSVNQSTVLWESKQCTAWIRVLYRVIQSGELRIKPLYSTNQSIIQLKSKHCAEWIKVWHSANHSTAQHESIGQKMRTKNDWYAADFVQHNEIISSSSCYSSDFHHDGGCGKLWAEWRVVNAVIELNQKYNKSVRCVTNVGRPHLTNGFVTR